MDVERELRMLVKSGKVEFGSRTGLKNAAKAKLVLVSSNCPPAARKAVEEACSKAKVPLYVYERTSVEVGSICGKPFPISVLAVFDAGSSNILGVGKEGTMAKPLDEGQGAKAAEAAGEAKEERGGGTRTQGERAAGPDEG